MVQKDDEGPLACQTPRSHLVHRLRRGEIVPRLQGREVYLIKEVHQVLALADDVLPHDELSIDQPVPAAAEHRPIGDASESVADLVVTPLPIAELREDDRLPDAERGLDVALMEPLVNP